MNQSNYGVRLEATAMSGLHQVIDRANGYSIMEAAINAARGNVTLLLATVNALEQAADRLFGPAPTPLQSGRAETAPCAPSLMRQMDEANDDLAALLSRLDNVANRFIALA